MSLDVLLVTDEDDFESALPTLTSLTQAIRRAPLDELTNGHHDTADVAIIDARTDLATARGVCRSLTANAPGVAVVAVVAGGTVLMEGWRQAVPSILMMWYAGMEGGHALADVLTGRQDPAGRLPFSVPTSPDHLPAFDRNARAVTYDRFHGQRLLDRLGVAPAFPHGFGLSYTSWSVDGARVEAVDAEGARLAVTVRNTGDRPGHHVVQVYGRSTAGPYADELTLVGFAPVQVPAGGSVRADVAVSFRPLAVWDAAGGRRVPPAVADVVLEVGSHAHDPVAVVVHPIG